LMAVGDRTSQQPDFCRLLRPRDTTAARGHVRLTADVARLRTVASRVRPSRPRRDRPATTEPHWPDTRSRMDLRPLLGARRFRRAVAHGELASVVPLDPAAAARDIPPTLRI